MQYQIVKASNEDELELKVNSLLGRGWKLQGGICSTAVCVTKSFGSPEAIEAFYQAMTKD